MFDRSNALLRYIRCGDEELVRGISAAVRDLDWNTIAFSMDDIEVVARRLPFIAIVLVCAFCTQADVPERFAGLSTSTEL
jgi:hypothetical protein